MWIFLTGMMGAGKTTIGRLLAEALQWRFIDLDAAIEEASGTSVAEIFAHSGEEAFRRLERTTLERHLEDDSQPGTVMALGGGAYVQDGVPQWLRSRGTTVYIEVPPDELERRLTDRETATRPLLGGVDPGHALTTLWHRRQGRYTLADVTVEGTQPPAAVVAQILTRIGRARTVAFTGLEVDLGRRSYPIWIDLGGVERVAALVGLALEAMAPPPDRVALITDTRVADLYLEDVAQGLTAGGWPVTRVVVPQGEQAKSVACLQDVWTALLEARFGRRDVVVALGGGVVGDLAGFAAATLLRGVRLIQVPTTVLSQVDSSVGGKTGINHPLGKNLVGAFHQPEAVVMALGMLGTLEPRQVRSGLAEVVKYAVIDGEDLLGWLEERAEGLVDSHGAHPELQARCCAIKAAIVAQDEREAGRRALLNLGHTFGHAIEALDGYGVVTHGEAVGLGMVLAARAGRLLLGAPPGLEARLTRLLDRLGLPTDVSGFLKRGDEMTRLILQDKKASGDHVGFILPIAPGQVVRHPIEARQIPVLLTHLASTGAEH